MVVLAQSVRHAVPPGGGELREERGWQREGPPLLELQTGHRRGDQQQALGVLRLDAALIAHAEQRGQLAVGDALTEPRLPAQPGGSHGQRPDSVTGVVLAVAESTLAVLPRLTPV